jgi:hypothetical protein
MLCSAQSLTAPSQTVTLQTLLTILNTTKATEIPAVIKGLSQDGQDTLMKYLYKGMAMPGWGDISGSVLLGWHEKVRFSSLCLPLLMQPFTVDGGRWHGMYCTNHDGQTNRLMQSIYCTILPPKSQRSTQSSCM